LRRGLRIHEEQAEQLGEGPRLLGTLVPRSAPLGTGNVDVVFRFARDSPLEGSGFELTVPLGRATASNLFLSPSKHLNPGDRRLSFRSAAAMIDR
jgi:hypothetical protein